MTEEKSDSQNLEEKNQTDMSNSDQIAVDEDHSQNKTQQLETELQVAKLEIEDWKDRTTRVTADLQNIIRQNELDLLQAKKSAKKSVVLTVVTFINTLNLAFNFTPKTDDEAVSKFITTLKLSFDRVVEDLKNLGIEIIIPEVGDVFNPEFMNILNPDGINNASEDVHIMQVVSCGIKIDNQLVQPANVMI